MKQLAGTCLALLAACASPITAHAQILSSLRRIPLAVEARGGVGIPLGDFADSDREVGAGAGFAFGIGASLRLVPLLAVYGEYQQTSFSCGECGRVDLDDRARDSGVELGARFTPPLPLGLWGMSPWARAGVVLHELEFSGNGGDASSDRGTGLAVGAGVSVPVAAGLSVTPGISFRTYPANFSFDQLDLPDRSVDVSSVRFDVGLRYRL